jgi:hypothetical protein
MAMRDGGIVRLYALDNVSEAGFMPAEKLVEKGRSFFSYSTAGVTRIYAALGANHEIDLVIRCHNMTELPDGVKYAIPEDGRQYRIDVAQPIYDDDAIDLTLVRLEDYYDVLAE